MTRRLVNVLTTLSLLLFVAVAALWVRSYSSRDNLAWTNDQGDGHFLSSPGGGSGLEWSRRRVGPLVESGHRLDWRAEAIDPRLIYVSIRPSRLGFGTETFSIIINTTRGAERVEWSGVVVPFWALLVVLGALPAARWGAAAIRRRKRARAAAGLCLNCGYDLRATPGRCPECGSAAEGKAA